MRARASLCVALLLLAGAASPSAAQITLDKIKKAIDQTTHKKPDTSHAAAAAAQPAQQLNAKVQETLMGPRSQRITLSDDGDHIGIITPKGSREVVLLDGVEGPVFDEIPRNSVFGTPEVQWSPTGGHSGYIGRRGGDYIAMVDGKEAVTLQTTESAKAQGYTDLRGWKFFFNKDGSHLAYLAHPTPAGWLVVMDGVKSPEYKSIDLNQMILNGKRLVYVVQTADQQWHVVADGKPGPGYASVTSLQLTPDGLHYAYLANKAGVGAAMGFAVVDGVESQAYFGVSDLEQAPDGRAAYMAATKQGDPGGHGGGAGGLMVGGLTVPNATTFNAAKALGAYVSRRVAWSPDGKRFAYIQPNTPNPGITVMVNGKPMGLTYSTAADLTFSPDGSHFFYVATSNTGNFPVIDGQELNGYNWVKNFQWSPDGKRYAFEASNNTGDWIVVDGKEQLKAHSYTTDGVRFSPDSKHIAYGAQTTVADYQPAVDGVTKPYKLHNFFTRNNPPLAFPALNWSPDGARLAFPGFTLDQLPKGGVFVDGVLYQGTTASFTYPAWSPDSKHFAAVNTTGKGWMVVLDGKQSPVFEDILSPNLGAARFTDARTYRLYSVKAGQVYRVTLDLGA